MVAAPPAACSRHRRRGSVVRCSTCDAPICGDCIVKTPVGFKCPRCAGTAPAAPAVARRPVMIGAVAAVVLVALAWALQRGGSGDGPAPPDDGAVAGPSERTVQITGAGGLALSGTLRVPRAAIHGPVPAVLVLGAFGQTDRNGVLSGDGVGDPLYQDISRALGDAGMASYRYDKRGSGQSPLPAETPLQLADMVEDARAALAFLAQRREVDPESVAVVGHGGGGLVALQLAADPRVRRVVLVSTPGRPLADVVADELARTGRPASADAVRAVVDQLRRDGSLPAGETLPPEVRAVFPADRPSWLRAIFDIDPQADARRVDVPVLVVRGERDTAITAADSDLLAEALGAHTEVLVRNADHTLTLPQPAPTGASPEGAAHEHAVGAATGNITRDDAVLGQIATWLGGGLGARRG